MIYLCELRLRNRSPFPSLCYLTALWVWWLHSIGDRLSNEYRTVGGIRIGRGSQNTRRKPFCVQHFPHVLTLDRTRSTAVRSRRITTRAIARPLRESRYRGQNTCTDVFRTGMRTSRCAHWIGRNCGTVSVVSSCRKMVLMNTLVISVMSRFFFCVNAQRRHVIRVAPLFLGRSARSQLLYRLRYPRVVRWNLADVSKEHQLYLQGRRVNQQNISWKQTANKAVQKVQNLTSNPAASDFFLCAIIAFSLET
jgi:hypothetical protein